MPRHYQIPHDPSLRVSAFLLRFSRKRQTLRPVVGNTINSKTGERGLFTENAAAESWCRREELRFFRGIPRQPV